LRTCLQHHDGADEESRKEHDGKGPSADVVHLVNRIFAVTWTREEIRDGMIGKFRVVLNLQDAFFCRARENCRHRGSFGSVGLLSSELQRRV